MFTEEEIGLLTHCLGLYEAEVDLRTEERQEVKELTEKLKRVIPPSICGMDVRDIVKKHLEEHLFDGLCSWSHECGCELSDLMPCFNFSISDCEPGYKVPCPYTNDEEGCLLDDIPEHFHISVYEPKTGDAE